MRMWRRNLGSEVGGVFYLERLTVKEWQRKRGTTKKKRRKRCRSGTSMSHPKKYPERREAKRRAVLCGLVLWTLGVFSCRALTLIFYGKREGLPSRNPRLRPPSTPVI